MKGLELSKRFYEECGRPMLEERFAHLLPYIAIGLVGSGSECFGYDDEISADHDFEPAFCIFLPNEETVGRRQAFELERAYAKLPRVFLGYKRSYVTAVGGNRHGVIRTADFYTAKTGAPDGELSAAEWLSLPEYALSEAVNGEVFFDGFGEFSRIRERLSHYPEDIRLKKLAGNLLLMAQSGQYNYPRCISRGESGAAQMAIFEFVKSAMAVIFLLEKRYMPYYKWSFRALRQIEGREGLASELEFLISSGNEKREAEKKIELIESICQRISTELNKRKISPSDSAEMECQAYATNNKIKDTNLRNMHVLAAV